MLTRMNKVIDNLWIGSIAAARDVDSLRKCGIKSILSAMRGKVTIPKGFAHYQISLDDSEDSDALVHFPDCIAWIDSEINKGKSVLVHCQAGMSRSATIVAAYLMYTMHLDVEAALDLLRKARPVTQPNDGFLAQLRVFHSAQCKRTRRNKETRAFYVERAVKEVLNGDGSNLEMDMFAKYPRTPSDSTPNTPYPQPRRRLRCKMCRQELATREHMIDHGQVGPATPAAGYMLSPAASRRSSSGEAIDISRRESVTGTTADGTHITRRPSESAESPKSSFGAGLTAMTPIIPPAPQGPPDTTIATTERHCSTSEHSRGNPPRRKSLGSNTIGSLSMTPMPNSPGPNSDRRSSATGQESGGPGSGSRRRRRSLLGLGGEVEEHMGKDNQRPSAFESDEEDGQNSGAANSKAMDQNTVTSMSSGLPSPALASPQELATQIHPNLAALRSSPLISALRSGNPLGMTPMKESDSATGKLRMLSMNSTSPPLLMPNLKCSGYFVEPMVWMEPFLEAGQMAGKIICPNKRCAAKLGNYDWAGVCCSCKEWVVPGFCIHKSKVDEIVI